MTSTLPPEVEDRPRSRVAATRGPGSLGPVRSQSLNPRVQADRLESPDRGAAGDAVPSSATSRWRAFPFPQRDDSPVYVDVLLRGSGGCRSFNGSLLEPPIEIGAVNA